MDDKWQEDIFTEMRFKTIGCREDLRKNVLSLPVQDQKEVWRILEEKNALLQCGNRTVQELARQVLLWNGLLTEAEILAERRKEEKENKDRRKEIGLE